MCFLGRIVSPTFHDFLTPTVQKVAVFGFWSWRKSFRLREFSGAGPNPTCLVSLEEEGRTQGSTEGGPRDSETDDGHLRVEKGDPWGETSPARPPTSNCVTQAREGSKCVLLTPRDGALWDGSPSKLIRSTRTHSGVPGRQRCCKGA